LPEQHLTGLLDVCVYFSSRRRHTRFKCDWSSDVCSSDLEVGELCFRGPSSLRGYYSAPGQTREALTADGFVRTGDLAKAHRIERSEERRVGKECRGGWSRSREGKREKRNGDGG